MGEDINVYCTRKFIENIIFELNEIDYKKSINNFDLVILESLKNVVADYTEENYLSQKCINNVLNYLSQARSMHLGKQANDIINDVITLVNTQKEDNSIILYRYELYKRRKNFKYATCDSKIINDEIENIHNSICFDLAVVTGHSDNVTDEEFVNNYLPYFVNSDLYYESINAILVENPIVFKDETFYNRLFSVLDINNELHKDTKSQNKKLIKKVKKINK